MSLASQLSFLESSTSTIQQINNNIVIASNSGVSSTATGALQITNGGLAVGGGVFVGGILTATSFVGTFNGTIGGGVSISTATNIAAGTAGQLHYQSAPSTTAFVGTATTGNFLQANYVGAPTWTSTGSMFVNSARYADNLTGGTPFQIPYQSAPGTTAFANSGTTGQFWQATTNGAPTWTTTASIYVANAVAATNLRAGTAMSIHYQSAADTTAFLAAGTAGYVLSTNGTGSAPTWIAVGSVTAGTSTQVQTVAQPASANYYPTFVSANNASATAMSVYTSSSVYVNPASGTLTAGIFQATNNGNGTNFQVGDDAWIGDINIANTIRITGQQNTSNAYIVFGTNDTTALGRAGAGGLTYGGNLIVHAGNTSTTFVNSARYADNVTGGAAGSIHYQSAASTTAMLALGTSGYVLTAGASAPQWTAIANLSATTATNIAGGTAGQLHYQTGPGATGFAGPGTFGQFLMSTGANAPVYQSTLTQAGGNIIITSNNAATSTITGALQVVNGGVGIGGNLYVGGEIVAQKLTIQLTTVTTTLVTTDDIISTYNYTNATSTITGALQVAGGAGIGRDLYVGGNITVLGTINASITGISTTATNIAGGTAGQLHYQSAPGATSFVSTATTGNFLQANYVGAPTWTTTASMYVNDAVKATNLRAGTAGQLHYQSAADTSGFVGPGTLGQILVSQGTSAPAYTNTSSIYVGRAVIADSASGGAGSVTNALTINNAGSGSASGITYNGSAAITISYNTIGAPLASQLTNGAATGSSNNSISSLDSRGTLYSPGDRSAGLFLDFKANATDSLADGGTYHGVITFRPYGQNNSDFSGGQAQQIGTTDNNNLWHRMSTSSSTWGTWYKILDTNNVGTITAGGSTTATNIAGGTAGQVPYQTAPGVTSFYGPGTAGQILVSNGAAAPVYTNTGSIYINRATVADQGNTQLQTASGTYYPTIVSANNVSATAMTHYTTSSFQINPATGFLTVGGNGGSIAPLNVTAIATLGGTAGNFIPMFTQQATGGSGGNTVYETAWRVRASAGTDWTTQKTHNAIWVDASFITPGTDTRCWWERHPNNGTHAWGNAATTFKFLDASGNMFLTGGSSQLNTGFTNKLNVSGSIVAGTATSTNGTTILQGQYGTGAITTFGTEYSTGGPVVGYGVYPSNAAIAAFFSSSGATLTRGAYTVAGNVHNWYVGASQTVVIGSAVTVANVMSLNASGQLGVGASYAGTSGALFAVNGAGYVNGTFTATGALVVGATTPGVAGSIQATNEITAYFSDRRLKENVVPIGNAVTKVLSLTGITYTPNELAESFGYDRTQEIVGLFADEVNAVLPQAVRPAPFDRGENGSSKSGENYLTVQYEKLVPLLVEAIKEQQQEIAQLRDLVNSLVNK